MILFAKTLLSWAAVICLAPPTTAHDRPIIGVLAVETSSGYGDTYIPAAYVKYLMMGGARVVAIRAKEAESYYRDMVQKLNGLLLPGGSVSTRYSEYALAARKLFSLAMDENLRGDYFPVWGTCLGFQTIVNAVSERNRLNSTPGTGDISLPLNLTSSADTSRPFRGIPSDLMLALSTEPLTYNTHNFGVRAEKFESDPKLRDFFTVLTTNNDANGRSFVSTYEAKNQSVPVYGTQWHPEMTSFNWNPSRSINRSLNAVRLAQHMANFFVQEARKSNHVFGSSKEEGRALIQAQDRRYFTSGKFYENFYFDFRT